MIDLIAHTRVKTPTAAAEFLIHHQEGELDALEDLSARLTEQVSQVLYDETTRLKLVANKLPLLFSTVKAREEMRLHRLSVSLANSSVLHIEQAKSGTEMLEKQLALYTSAFMQGERKRIELVESKLQSAHPDRILRLGFSITRIGGKAVKNADEVKEGDEIETTLASGTLRSVVGKLKIEN